MKNIEEFNVSILYTNDTKLMNGGGIFKNFGKSYTLENKTYRTCKYQAFWGVTYNIRNPSNSRLKSLVKEKMENILYIYKNQIFDKEKQEALFLA